MSAASIAKRLLRSKRKFLYSSVGLLAAMLLCSMLLRESNAVAARQELLESIRSLNTDDPEYQRVMCGPISLTIAIKQLDRPADVRNLAAYCKVTSLGVSMSDLQRAADSQRSMTAHIGPMNWDRLLKWNGTVVIHVGGNHFVAVDPRVRSKHIDGTELVQVFNPGQPAEFWSREKLEDQLSETALFITTELKEPEPEEFHCGTESTNRNAMPS